MAHFAELDCNNTVLRVLVVDDKMMLDVNGNESEEIGVAFLQSLFGKNSVWKQTSYNTRSNQHIKGGRPLRKNYAGIGYHYDQILDGFIAPKPEGDGWELNEAEGMWRNPAQEAALALGRKNTKLEITYV